MTRFSGTAVFSDGQFVTAQGMTGIAVGWVAGSLGKLVAVKITAKTGGMHGRTIVVPPKFVVSRKGRKGKGPLRRVRVQ